MKWTRSKNKTEHHKHIMVSKTEGKLKVTSESNHGKRTQKQEARAKQEAEAQKESKEIDSSKDSGTNYLRLALYIFASILVISLGAYLYFRQRDNSPSRSVTRTPDSPRRDFRKEAVVEPQEEQPSEAEVKSETQEEQPSEAEVKSETQEEQSPEDEKK